MEKIENYIKRNFCIECRQYKKGCDGFVSTKYDLCSDFEEK